MPRRRLPAGAPDAPRLVRDRAVLFLEAQDGPVSSALLAREVLGLHQGSDPACAAILAPVLAGDPRIARAPDGRWILGEPAPQASPEGEPLRARAWAVWAIESEGRAGAVVRVEAGRIVAERAEPSVDDDDAAIAGAPLPAESWQRLCALGAGALATSWDPAGLVESAIARGSAVSYGGGSPDASPDADAPGPCGFVPLAALARAGLGPPRPRTLARLAASLGVRFVEDDAPVARARLAAECLAALLEREPLADRSEAGLQALLEARAQAPPALESPDGALRLALDALPAEPGVYRFFDKEGRLLYVGKARDLRQRVGSYFAARAVPDPRTAGWIGSVDRIEHERSGSELEALLREASQIAVRAPSQNRQRAVHERSGRTIGDLVLVQGAERPGAVRIALVKGGAIAARLVLGPRGGGRARLRALVEEIYFQGAPRSRSTASSRGAAREASRALLLSWLRRQPPGIPALDPTDDPGPDEACARIHRYAAALLRGETGVTFR